MKRAISLFLLTASCAFAQMDDVAFISSLSETNIPPSTWNPITNGVTLSYYDISTITANNGDVITTIPDLGPKAYHLITTNSPKYMVNASTNSGQPHIGFNIFGGTLQMAMTNISITYPQPTFIIMVMDSRILSGALESILDNSPYNSGSDIYQAVYGFAPGTPTRIASGLEYTTTFNNYTTTRIYEWSFNGASSYMKTNNVNVITGNAGTLGRKGIAIAGNRLPTSGHVPMNFYLAAFYTNALSATERSNVYYYLSTRFSIPVTY